MKGAGEAKRANHHLTRGQRVGSACVRADGDRGAHELAPPKNLENIAANEGRCFDQYQPGRFAPH
jgi:hypothetical protein